MSIPRNAVLRALGLVVGGSLPLLAAAGAGAQSTAGDVTLTSAPSTSHLIVNTQGSKAPYGLGFDLADTGPSKTTINALPSGVRAMVWLGQKCPTKATDAFRSTVRSLAGNPKVFGYYLSDEPHVADCPKGPAALATRSQYIRDVTNGTQKSLIVLSRNADYKAFRPSVTHVSYFGIDAYPCSVNNTPRCDYSKIPTKVKAAADRGIPRWRQVPVFQAFGQENTQEKYYLQPTAKELTIILHYWKDALPTPALDYTYGWANQSSSDPTLVDSTALQQVFDSYLR